MYGPKGACLAAGLSLRFFFFQAEDGIRDLTVTGVQTCALPICRLCRLDPRLGGALCRRLLRTDGRRRLAFHVRRRARRRGGPGTVQAERSHGLLVELPARLDRKSTRLNSSHSQISYAVFRLTQT